ncbi:MAG: peptidoglycan editing factor PgeF [Clostridium sp.]
MKVKKIDGYEFLTFDERKLKVVFSTKKNNLNLNKNLEIGKENLKKLKKIFKVKDIQYLNQIHSDIIYNYDKKNIKNLEGDAIITKREDVAIGVFTADCVPVIVADIKNNIVASIHSGWRGTYDKIVFKTIKKMIEEYDCKIENLKIFIGPHNKVCCYEVSLELINKFKELSIYRNEDINMGRYLDLERCIIIQVELLGVKKENIISVNQCTYCSKEHEFYSYRKENEREGRLFSFVYMK